MGRYNGLTEQNITNYAMDQHWLR